MLRTSALSGPAAVDMISLGSHLGARPDLRGRVLKPLIAVAALTLIALVWGFTAVSVGGAEREAQMNAESHVANLALSVEWQFHEQLQSIDQMMLFLSAEWKADPAHPDPASWRRHANVLGMVSPQVSMLDRAGLVSASTQPGLVGADLSSRAYFQAQKASPGMGLFVAPAAAQANTTGRWEVSLSRRLEYEDGGFAGALVVTYDPWTGPSLLEQVDLGPRGLIALVAADGAMRALVSPQPMRPDQDIGASAMFRAAVLHPQGAWTGPSAPDGVTRVHAFRRLRGQELTIVIGLERKAALRDAAILSSTARLFAWGISLGVGLMALLLLHEVRAARRREQRLAWDGAALEAAYAEAEGAQASAEAKTAQLEGTLAGMSDGVMLLDPQLRVMRWNDRFPAYTGVPLDILRVGVPMEDVLRAQARAGEFGHVDVEKEVRRRMRRLRDFSGVGTQERTRPSGASLELRRSALPGGGFVTLYTDITARKQAEEAQAEARRIADDASAQQAHFVATVSHEIRTPLNAVVNSLALLDQSGLSPPQHRLARTARQAGDALLDLVNDILEMSRMEAGQLQLRPGPFELRALLDGVADMFRNQAAARHARIVVEVAPATPDSLRADSSRVRQVLMNLVSNAAKFAVPGAITLHASSATQGEGRGDGPTLLLAVRDAGPRITEREAAQLFQPFSRLGHAHDTGTPGTGLGLAICERLVRLMGGRIGLRPSPEGGNEFWLTLPLELAPARLDLSPHPVRRQRRSLLLLVEDIPANHLVVAIMLRREGHRVDVAESGPEAIRMVQATPYDLVFMDLNMPGMSGYDAAGHIRALPGPEARVPIVALTATTAPEDRARCLDAGMNDLIGKPVRAAELIAFVNRVTWQPGLAGVGLAGVGLASVGLASMGLASVGADGPSLDLARLADLRAGLPPSTLPALVEQCLAEIGERLPSLHAALALGEPSATEARAHALAGMAGTYGLAGLERRMRNVMAAARRDDAAGAALAARDLELELARASEAIRAELRLIAA